MFGGLELKGPSETKKEPSSGFSFLSKTVAPADEEPIESKPIENNNEEPSLSSGFSFLSQNIASQTVGSDLQREQDTGPSDEVAAEIPAATSSGFSFLSALANSAIKSEENNPSVPVKSGGSMFDMLSLAQQKTFTPASEPESPTNTTTKSHSSHDDILSLSNPTQAVGSGVVFHGAVKPKVVKKKTRAKKVGGGANISGLPPMIPLSNQISSTTYDQNTQEDEDEDENIKEPAGSQNTFSNLSQAANDAATRAEEFMSQKRQFDMAKRSSLYSGRYSNDSSVVEDYGDSSSSFTPASIQDHDDSEEYRRAMAAAEDAKAHFASSKKSNVFGNMSIGGFFKTKKNGPSIESRSSHGSWSSHGPDTKKEIIQVPTYGIPSYSQSPNDEGPHDHANKSQTFMESEMQDESVQMENSRYELEQRQYQAAQKKLKEAEAEAESQRKAELARLKEEKEKQIREEEELAKRTPQQKLSSLLQAFEQKVQTATLAVTDLRNERAALVEKKALAEKQSCLLTQRISQAETQQTQAAECEDFELADRLAAVISKYQEEKEEKSQVVDSINTLIEDIQSKTFGAIKSVWHCFIHVQDDLKSFSKEEQASDINDSAELLKKFELNTKRLSSENERLAADLKTIERDEELARIEREELEGLISEQTFDIEEQYRCSKKKLDGINSEIEELRKQLEAKEMEAAEVKMELHTHEETIEGIRSNFSRQLTRLGKKEEAVLESRRDWENEESQYKKASEEHEAEVMAHTEALVAHDNIIIQVKEEIIIAEELARIIAQEFVNDKQSNTEDPNKDVLLIQAEVLEVEAALEEANRTLIIANSIITNLQEEIASITEQLPMLEADKTMAASKRDFKAAAKASKEIKESQNKLAQCKERLDGEITQKREHAEKEVHSLQISLEEKRLLAHEIEKDGCKRRMAQIAKKVISLEKLRESICGTEEDPKLSVKSVGGFIIDTQISFLMTEGDELDKKYGGWSDIMLEYATKVNLNEDIDYNDSHNTDMNDSYNHEDSQMVEDENYCDKETDHVEEETVNIDNDKQSKIESYKHLLTQLGEMERKLSNAIEMEDYEEAAELDDVIQNIKAEMSELNIVTADLEFDNPVIVNNQEDVTDQVEEIKEAAMGDTDLNADRVESDDILQDKADDQCENTDHDKTDQVEECMSDVDLEEDVDL